MIFFDDYLQRQSSKTQAQGRRRFLLLACYKSFRDLIN